MLESLRKKAMGVKGKEDERKLDERRGEETERMRQRRDETGRMKKSGSRGKRLAGYDRGLRADKTISVPTLPCCERASFLLIQHLSTNPL